MWSCGRVTARSCVKLFRVTAVNICAGQPVPPLPAMAPQGVYCVGHFRHLSLANAFIFNQFSFFFLSRKMKWIGPVGRRRRISAGFTASRRDVIRLWCEKTRCRQRRLRSVRRPAEFQSLVVETISATSVRAECIRLNARPTCIAPVSASVSSPNTPASKRNLSEYVL